MKEVGAFDAKNRFGQLLDWVESGEHVVITRRGKVVAKLVPPTIEIEPEAAMAAVARIKDGRKGFTLGGIGIKELIEEGRR